MANNSDSNVIISSSSNDIEWTNEHEQILVEWADKAMCYRWLHSRSHFMFSSLNAWYTIPVIVISTLTGTANFAQERVPIDYQNYFVMIVGGFNILAGIITTIQQFLKITQLNESHRVASIAWDKFYRNIRIELAKHPDERMNVTQMIKMCKEEFDRLMETSPTIPDKIIKAFKNEFSNLNENDNTIPKIIKPEICDVLISTELSRNPWASEENKNKKLNLQISKEKQNYEIIYNFKRTFFNLNNREALESEIVDNLKDKIDTSIIIKVLEKINKNENDIESTISQNNQINLF
uniref:SMODS and SLOG-associating 2TM effector domain-containing protein n=1 Tax=viral metagenome TaxID=1070528 RepID=A0A6C0KP43_9ZZZZ